MKAFVISSSWTCVIFLLDRWAFKQHRNGWNYIIMGIIAFWVVFLCQSLDAKTIMVCNPMGIEFIETNDLTDVLEDIKDKEVYLTQNERNYFFKKAEKFTRDAMFCAEKAERLCWYLPNRAHRNFTTTAVKGAVASLAGTDARSRIISSCIAVLFDYFDDVTEEWQEIHNKLCWSAYYFEMAEFYQDLLFRDSLKG